VVALLACVAVLELELRVGLSLEEQQEHQSRILRRQLDNVSSSSTIQATPTYSPKMTVGAPPNSWILPSTTSRTTSDTGLWASDWESQWVDPKTTSTGQPSTMTTTLTATSITPYIPLSSIIPDTLPSMRGDGSLTGSRLFASEFDTYGLSPSTESQIPGSTASVVSPTGSTGLATTTVASLTVSYPVMLTTQTKVGSNGDVVTSVSEITSWLPTSIALTEATSIGSTPPTITPDAQQPDELDLGLTITGLQYFRAMYLPTVVAVLLKLVWSIVFASTKMMEPFYLLSRKRGASAKDSLVADYLISTLSLDGIHNLFAGHPVVILASLAYVCISLLPALATQSTTIRAIGICYSTTGQSHCQPKWELNITYARLLQWTLSVTVIFILGMMILSARRHSGVFSNPSSIASVASLLSNDELIAGIRKVPQNDIHSSNRKCFDAFIFKLAQYTTVSGHVRYGITKISDPSHSPKPDMRDQYNPPTRSNTSPHEHPGSNDRSWISSRFITDVIFLLGILGLLSVTVAYYLVHEDNGFNNFFNRHPLRTFVLTLTASILDSRWKQLEHEVRLMTPYRRLFRGSAEPDNTILVTHNATAVTSLFSALWHGNYFHALVALVATLSDVLIIVIGSVPHSSAQFQMDYLVCIHASWVILAIMAAMMMALFRWRAINEKMVMPQTPNTLLAVCQLLCNTGNGLCEEVAGDETLTSSERNQKIRLNNTRYWAGWITDLDSSRRWVVEKEKPHKM